MQQSIIGRVIDNYEITAILGKGGMGVVYKAKDMTLDRYVALKMMDDNFARDEEFLKRFKSEAKALAKLQNPNIVSVFALRETEIGFALVMEFVEGNTLADRIRLQGAMSPAIAIPIFKQLLIALGDAHRNNVIHRDIKPGNVMITTDNVVKVTDFGLAKIQQVINATVTMGTGGTLYYMSPEQIRALSNVDARGDIYSLGMTLYETLTGRVPFETDATDFDIRQKIVEGKIPSPDKFNPALPKDLVQIVIKSIHRDPNKRFQTCAEMFEALLKVHLRPANGKQTPTTVDPLPVIAKPKQLSSSSLKIYLPIVLGVLLIAGYFLAQPFLTSSAKLTIESDPAGSKVMIDGKPVGVTPIKDYYTAAGNTTIRVDQEGYFVRDTILSLKNGESIALSMGLTKLPERSIPLVDEKKNPLVLEKPKAVPPAGKATLRLKAEPEGTVSVDGGSKSNNENAFQVTAGERSILFENPKYGSKRITVKVKPGEIKKLTCYFETYVSIVASGDAAWGLVVLDGKTTDVQTPIDGLPLGPGRHRISVAKIGFETVEGEKVVNVAPSFEKKTERLAFTLKRK